MDHEAQEEERRLYIRNFKIAGIFLLVALGFYVKFEFEQRAKRAEAEKASAVIRAETSRKIDERKAQIKLRCEDDLISTVAEVESLTKSGKPQEALDHLQPCAFNLSDPNAIAARDRAQRALEIMVAADNKRKAAEEKRTAEIEKRRRKTEGVRIGMSQQDVLDSSWGRPQKVNTTTTARGVRQQWVYGGGNYLYFEDGMLTSIQN